MLIPGFIFFTSVIFVSVIVGSNISIRVLIKNQNANIPAIIDNDTPIQNKYRKI